MRTLTAIMAAALAILPTAPGAAGAPPDDLSDDPLDRGALLALPSVYRVDVTLRVDALRRGDGHRIPLPAQARELNERGTAFAVAPGGWLVTAAHVAAPDDGTAARLAYQAKLALEGKPHSDAVAAEYVDEAGVTPVGARVTRLVVRQADAGQGAAAARTYMPTRVVPSDRADLALLRIRAPGAPALALAESASIGTPVASVGFGAGSAFAEPARGDLEPAVRRGVIARTGIIDEDEPTARPGMLVTIPLESGDSGAPVVDADGAARGVAVIRTADGGIAERATEVRQLLATEGVEAAPGRSAQLFRGGMAAFWNLDLAAAQRGLAAAERAFPDHALAGLEARRARELAGADFTLVGGRRRQGFLLALGALAVIAAAACGLGLARQGGGGRGSLGTPTERG
ncbi:MAG TPA: serine protease [Miltoncostaeaceae bacterium]|nr:serine protease [Miltoncostaeaceae bacterium]